MHDRSHGEVVLLTGASSFVGRRLLSEILVDAPAFVYALVPMATGTEAQSFLASLPHEARARVKLLEGRSTSLDLGLSGADFKRLAAELTRIHHADVTRDPGADRKTA